MTITLGIASNFSGKYSLCLIRDGLFECSVSIDIPTVYGKKYSLQREVEFFLKSNRLSIKDLDFVALSNGDPKIKNFASPFFSNLLELAKIIPKSTKIVLVDYYQSIVFSIAPFLENKAAILISNSGEKHSLVGFWDKDSLKIVENTPISSWDSYSELNMFQEQNDSNIIACVGNNFDDSVKNAGLLYNTHFSDVRIMPMNRLSYLSLGAAVSVLLANGEKLKEKWPISPFKGEKFDMKSQNFDSKIVSTIYDYETKDSENMKNIAQVLSEGKSVGVYRGNSEVGEIGLGNKCILHPMTKTPKEEYKNKHIASLMYSEIFDKFEFFGLSSYWYANVSVKGSNSGNAFRDVQLLDKFLYPDFCELLEYYKKLTGLNMIEVSSLKSGASLVNNSEADCLYLGGTGIIRKKD